MLFLCFWYLGRVKRTVTAGSAEHAAAAAAKKKGGLDNVLAAIDGPKSISTVSLCNAVESIAWLLKALPWICLRILGMFVLVVRIETTMGGGFES